MFFFFKQKTAYEMRISDWSSDVCSSDLGRNLSRSVRPGAERVLIAALARVAPPPVFLDARHPRRVRLQQGRAERLRRQGGDTLGQALEAATFAGAQLRQRQHGIVAPDLGALLHCPRLRAQQEVGDRKSTRLNSSP